MSSIRHGPAASLAWGVLGAAGAIFILLMLTVPADSSNVHTDGQARRKTDRLLASGGRAERDIHTTSQGPEQTINVTSLPEPLNFTDANVTGLTTGAPSGGGDTGQGSVAIVGVFFGALLGCAIIGGALYLLIRHKRSQSAEYNRSVQVHMSSTRNAGVYVDLVEPSNLRQQAPNYTSLKQQRVAKGDRLMQSDLYEYDSDDEVCVYK